MSARKYVAVWRIHLKESARYPLDLLSSGFITLIYAFIMYFLWKTMYQYTTLSGFTFVQVVWYITLAQAMRSLSGKPVREISQSIQDGTITNFLNKPLDYLWLQLAIQTGKTFLQWVIAILMTVITFSLLVGFPPVTALDLPFILITVLAGVIINFLIGFCIATSAFWIEDARPLHWVYDKFIFILGGFLFPLALLPPLLERIATSLPTAYYLYRPLQLAVGFTWPTFLKTILIQAGIVIALVICATWLLRKGMRQLSVNGG